MCAGGTPKPSKTFPHATHRAPHLTPPHTAHTHPKHTLPHTWIVLIAATPSQPASSAARAGAVMSVTLGVIFAHTGTVAAALTQPETSDSRSQSWPIAMPMRRSGMPCGHEKLSSNAST